MGYSVLFSGPLAKEEREREAKEQQKVVELKIKIRNDEIERDKERENQKRTRSNTTGSTPNTEHQHSQSIPMRSTSHSSEAVNSGTSNISSSLPASSTRGASRSVSSQRVPPPTEVDLEELMMMEAIRLSLLMTPNAPQEITQDSDIISRSNISEMESLATTRSQTPPPLDRTTKPQDTSPNTSIVNSPSSNILSPIEGSSYSSSSNSSSLGNMNEEEFELALAISMSLNHGVIQTTSTLELNDDVSE